MVSNYKGTAKDDDDEDDNKDAYLKPPTALLRRPPTKALSAQACYANANKASINLFCRQIWFKLEGKNTAKSQELEDGINDLEREALARYLVHFLGPDVDPKDVDAADSVDPKLLENRRQIAVWTKVLHLMFSELPEEEKKGWVDKAAELKAESKLPPAYEYIAQYVPSLRYFLSQYNS